MQQQKFKVFFEKLFKSASKMISSKQITDTENLHLPSVHHINVLPADLEPALPVSSFTSLLSAFFLVFYVFCGCLFVLLSSLLPFIPFIFLFFFCLWVLAFYPPLSVPPFLP